VSPGIIFLSSDLQKRSLCWKDRCVVALSVSETADRVRFLSFYMALAYCCGFFKTWKNIKITSFHDFNTEQLDGEFNQYNS
jgi:hypothetical protein